MVGQVKPGAKVEITVVEALTDPGSADRANEDRYGANDACAFVIDGATGLGERQIMTEAGSDAGWLADLAAEAFQQNVSSATALSDVVRGIAEQAEHGYSSAANGEAMPRYAWPTASFAMLRATDDGLRFAGLGDCTLLLERSDGRVEMHSPLPLIGEVEARGAAYHIRRLGGIGASGSLVRHAETLAHLREIRQHHNTPASGVWTLGLVPDAADHLVDIALEPGSFTGLLCSDGFAALVETYGRHTPQSLIAAAKAKGLATLMDELRDIEHRIDPQALKYPRFKRSDDATAMLLSVSG